MPSPRSSSDNSRRALPQYRRLPTAEAAVSPLAWKYGRAVRARRRELDLSQRELAVKVDLGRTSIANIEAGRSAPSVQHLLNMATVLNMDPLELLRRATSEES